MYTCRFRSTFNSKVTYKVLKIYGHVLEVRYVSSSENSHKGDGYTHTGGFNPVRILIPLRLITNEETMIFADLII